MSANTTTALGAQWSASSFTGLRVIVNLPFALSTITRLPASIRSFSANQG